MPRGTELEAYEANSDHPELPAGGQLRMRSGCLGRSPENAYQESTYRGVIIMRVKHVLLSTAASLAVALVAASVGAVAAKAEPGLSGQVTGAGGPMEGVLVTAKKNGSGIAYTVVSDANGRYSFPAGKIESGEYTLRISATGFDLDG